MNEEDTRVIMETVTKGNDVVEQFRKIQENPALNGAENALTAEEHKILERWIEDCGVAALAGTQILNRVSGDWQHKKD